jgi:hypothetical protein
MMLTITDTRADHTCQGYSRREFLRVGGLALGGLTLADLLAARARAAAAGYEIRDRSVVLLFLQGGPPQHETFDPKLSAPAEVRTTTGEVQTKLPGVTFGGTFPQLAARVDGLAVVRSYASRNGGHSYDPVTTGGNVLKASMSALYAQLAGTTHPVSGMPSSVLVLPEAVREGLKLQGNFETGALPTLTTPGQLGAQCEAFNPVGGTELKRAMELRIPRARLEDRRLLLRGFDGLRRELDAAGALDRADRFQQQAFEVVTRGLAGAFDLSREDRHTLERYDTTRLFRMEDWTKFVNMRRTTNLLGRQLLLARRLIEAGCGFVTVSDCGWDLHADGNSARGMTAMQVLGGQVDHAVAAFLDDVRERGLADKVLLIVTGEMGRTPRLNRNGGRDHWADLTPLLFAGGTLKMGQVVGRSDPHGGRPATEAYTPANLLATVLHYLFDLGRLRLRTELSRDLKNATDNGQPISALF